MLIKVGSYLLTLKEIDKLKKISEILFYLGIVLVFAFPLISEPTFIEEKQLKNTPILRRAIDKDTFTKNYRDYLAAMNDTNTSSNNILTWCLNILMGNNIFRSTNLVLEIFYFLKYNFLIYINF